jgi:hypothetical protein
MRGLLHRFNVTGSFPLRSPFLIAALLAFAACGRSDSGSTTSTSLATDVPPTGVGAIVDWEDPSKFAELEGGWAVRACEGEAPLLCVERAGQTVGLVEAMSYPIASFEDLDPNGDRDENLDRFAAGFVEAIGSDRVLGCGAEYGFDPFPVEDFVLGGTPGVSFGFVGTLPDGSSSELNLQYATIVGDQIVSIVAIAYDEGGCPGRDELSSFDTATLSEFRPLLEEVLHESPLPEVVQAPPDIGY